MKIISNRFLLKIFTLILFILLGCEVPPGADVSYSIRFDNNSDQNLYLFVNYLYPDTSLPSQKPYLDYVASMHSRNIYSSVKWDKVFDQLPQDTLSLFLIISDSLEIYGWETIATKQKIVARLDLSYNDLDQNSFIVKYP